MSSVYHIKRKTVKPVEKKVEEKPVEKEAPVLETLDDDMILFDTTGKPGKEKKKKKSFFGFHSEKEEEETLEEVIESKVLPEEEEITEITGVSEDTLEFSEVREEPKEEETESDRAEKTAVFDAAAVTSEKSAEEAEVSEETEEKPEASEEENGEALSDQDLILKEIFGAVPKKDENDNEAVITSEEKLREIFSGSSNGNNAVETEDDYVAVDDKMTEGTKEFKGHFASLEDALNAYVPETSNDEEIVVADEMVSDSENPYSDSFDDSDEEVVPKKELLPEEYTEPEQYDEFAESLRTKSFRSLCSAMWVFLVALFAFYLESASFTNIYHPVFLSPKGALKTVYYLADIQLVLIAAIIMLQNVTDGIKNFFRGKPDRDTVLFLTMFVSVAHSVCLIAFDAENATVFGIIPIAFAFFTAIANSLDTKRIYRSFRVFASKKPKISAESVVGESAETEAYAEMIDGEPSVYTVAKTEFIDNFFKKSNARSSHDSSYLTVIIISVIFSALYAGFYIWQGEDALSVISKFAVMALMTLPLSSLFTTIIPFSRISKSAYKKECAIAGVDSADKYSSADIISFVDDEVIPPKYVKITTIRTYGSTKIDSAILYAAQVFKKLGGPLSQVFRKTIASAYEEISEDFDFLEITADGLCAKIDGQEVFIGNKEYMAFYDFGYTKDDADEEFENTKGRIMYMVIGSGLAAKFYIRYFVSAKFKKTLQTLNKRNVGVAVKTCDPNVDSSLIKMLLKDEEALVEIIKTTDAMKETPPSEHSDSGIVCTSNTTNMLKTFISCDTLVKLIKTNVLMKVLSTVCGAGILIYLTFTGHFDDVTSLFVLLYNLIWLIPTVGTSLTER